MIEISPLHPDPRSVMLQMLERLPAERAARLEQRMTAVDAALSEHGEEVLAALRRYGVVPAGCEWLLDLYDLEAGGRAAEAAALAASWITEHLRCGDDETVGVALLYVDERRISADTMRSILDATARSAPRLPERASAQARFGA